MAKLLDEKGISSFQQIYQLSQEISDELHPQSEKLLKQSQTIHFWDFEEDESCEIDFLVQTKQVA